MPSLFDIGKSGLQAYRQSLAVTGQNIANVNTEGYKKRDAALEEISAAGGGVTEISDQTGLGVRVEEIRRAFDEFLLDKSRQANSVYEKAKTFSNETKDLENLLLPGDSNISSSMGNFFNALQEVAVAAEDQAPRIVAIEKGKDLASQFNSYSNRLDNHKLRIQNQANDAVTSVNILTKQIANINEDLLNSGLTSQASNAKLDQRDNLIDKLSQLSQITVNYGARGEAQIRLGNSGSGPLLLDKTDSITIGIELKNSRLQPVVGLSKIATNQIQGGLISGLTDAYALSENTHQEINNLAIIVNREFNRINKSGLDLDGKIGKNMFSLTSLEAIPNPTNRTSVGVEISIDDPEKITRENFKLSYLADNNQWRLTSENTETALLGSEKIVASGFTITFFGQALDGDEFTLKPTNESEGMKFNLERPQDIAAASKSLISSSTSNIGEANLEEIALISVKDETTLKNVENIFSNGLSPIISSEFNSDGGAAIIPKGTSSINLGSYIAQPTAKFSLSSTDVSSLTSITLTLANSSSVTVDLTGATSLQEVAEILNNGIDVNGSSHTFRSLGLFAAGGNSNLTIASNDQNFSTATVSIGSTLNGVITNPSVSSASNLQIFTREGRHIAGNVLSSTEVATFLTQENGFNTSSEYRADYLNGILAEQYRGINVDRSTTSGNHKISYGANGTAVSAQRASSTVPSSHVTAAYTLTLNSDNTDAVSISVPIESSAGYVAGLINTNANNTGIQASALTRIKVPAPSSDGTISFTLKSKSGTNSSVSISASVLSTDLTNLATSINNFSGKTGVSAFLSNDKKSLIMENSNGDDIQVTSFTSPSSLTVSILNNDFSDSGASVAIDSSNFRAARFSGELLLESSTGFTSANGGGSTVTAAQDALRGGYYEINSTSTGESKTIKPKAFQSDLSSANHNGDTASSSILSYGLTLSATGTGSSFTTTQDLSLQDEISSSLISSKLAEGLRANSPSIEIEGTSIASLPENGSSFKINHDGLTYKLTMQDGEVLVSGGEKDKISAYFEDKSSLTVNTTSFSNTSTISFTEHGLKTGDAVTYNAAEKVTVDTTAFSSTTNITSTSHGFSTGDPIVYTANGSQAINGLVSGTTYYAISVDSNTFAVATTSTNANNGVKLTISGGTGGSKSDTFASPINGLTDGGTYFVVKTDEHNFRLANTFALATAASPSVVTITGGSGGNALDNFDPGKNLYLSAGKTISASQFSFATDSINDTNAALFGMNDGVVKTSMTGTSITTPSGSDSTHFHLTLDDYANSIGVFVRTSSKTINTSTVNASSTTLTSSSHGFKTGDKILYTAAATAMTGLTSGTSYYAKVIDANTFSLASSFANATAETPTLLSFGGGNGNASDTFKTVYAEAYISDDIGTPTTASSLGIEVEINQVSDSNAQISIIKSADKNNIVIDNVLSGYGASSESFGFKTNLTQVNVLGDNIKLTSIGSSGFNTPETSAVSVTVPSNSMKSLSGSNLNISNLPPEDLIIIMTGSGARKISAEYGAISPVVEDAEYKLVVDSTNSNKVEIFEANTLHSIATRLIPDNGVITAVEKSLKFTGDNNINDSFTISNNKNGIGDNRNVLQMIALQESDVNGVNSGSFQDIFNATAAEIGTSVRTSEMTEETALASRDEAKALEDEVSGVVMDEEASNLIQFQQAYQANARIIQTARELFDSLMSVIRS
tara:strand:- start:7613 stop:12694 length:5082 start_codon:yes stop_codon:yes gene_type:complete